MASVFHLMMLFQQYGLHYVELSWQTLVFNA